MFTVKQIKDHQLFVVHWEGYAHKTVLANYIYEDVDMAHLLAQAANNEKWHLNEVAMKTNFKVSHFMFVSDKSEKFGIRFLGVLNSDSDYTTEGTIRFKLSDLKSVRKKIIKV